VAALKASETNSIPRLTELDLNGYVLGFTLLVTMLTGFASGLAPALQSPSLRETNRSQAAAAARLECAACS
jgi:hypothetical protein